MNTTKILIIGVVILAVVLGGYMLLSPPSSPSSSGSADVDSAGVREAAKRGATIVDVRSAGEYSAGHIPGAVNVEVSTLETGLADADKKAEYVVYCATGNRSLQAVTWMKSQGFSNIKHLSKGIVSWDGEIVGGAEPGDITLTTGGTTPKVPPASEASGTDTISSEVMADPLIKPTGKPVLVEFYTDT